jgi:hypothetical protein
MSITPPRVENLFADALARAQAKRVAFIELACGEDAELRAPGSIGNFEMSAFRPVKLSPDPMTSIQRPAARYPTPFP